MCCKTGLPRTAIIGLGRSNVRSRMRVPRPAARMTALVILVMGNNAAGGARLSRDVDCKEMLDSPQIYTNEHRLRNPESLAEICDNLSSSVAKFPFLFLGASRLDDL